MTDGQRPNLQNPDGHMGESQPWYKKKRVWVAVLVGLVIIGQASRLSQANRDETFTPKVDTSTNAFSLDDSQIQSALLTEADLPSGFSLDPESTSSAAQSLISGCNSIDALTSIATSAEARGRVIFTSEDSPTHYLREILETDATVPSIYSEFKKASDKCSEYKVSNGDGTSSTATVDDLDIPKLGDDSQAVSFTVELPQGTLHANIVAARIGHTLTVIYNSNVGDLDSSQTEVIAKKAVDKVAAAK